MRICVVLFNFDQRVFGLPTDGNERNVFSKTISRNSIERHRHIVSFSSTVGTSSPHSKTCQHLSTASLPSTRSASEEHVDQHALPGPFGHLAHRNVFRGFSNKRPKNALRSRTVGARKAWVACVV